MGVNTFCATPAHVTAGWFNLTGVQARCAATSSAALDRRARRTNARATMPVQRCPQANARKPTLLRIASHSLTTHHRRARPQVLLYIYMALVEDYM